MTDIYSNGSAFAAIHADGSVTTWGFGAFGGDSSDVNSELDGSIDVVSIETTHSAFAALRTDGSVITWGNDNDGGDSSSVSDKLDGTDLDVLRLWSNASSFAALLDDGSVVTWGDPTTGGDSSDVVDALNGTTNVKEIYASNNAFVALMTDNTVVAWGDPDYGGVSELPSELDGKQVASIVANEAAFAAILTDGSVVTWGQGTYGGDSSYVSSALDGTTNVTSVVASGNGFSALREDGSVVSWGGGLLEQDMDKIQTTLDGDVDVVKIIANDAAFAAIDENNNVYGWGNLEYGGNTNGVDMAEGSSNGIRLIINGNAIQTRGGMTLTGVEVLCDLTDADDLTATTGEDGTFSMDFGDLEGSGLSNVQFTASLNDENIGSSIDIDDALATLRLSVGLGVSEGSEVSSDALIAADFNGDGVVNSQDALEIYEYSQNVGNQDNDPGWLFIDADAALESLTKGNVDFNLGVAVDQLSSNTNINLMGILRGDVNDSYGG